MSGATSTATTGTLAASAVFSTVPAAELSNGEKMMPLAPSVIEFFTPGDLLGGVELGVERLQQFDALRLRLRDDVLVVGGPERRRQRREIDRDLRRVGRAGGAGERRRADAASAALMAGVHVCIFVFLPVAFRWLHRSATFVRGDGDGAHGGAGKSSERRETASSRRADAGNLYRAITLYARHNSSVHRNVR